MFSDKIRCRVLFSNQLNKFPVLTKFIVTNKQSETYLGDIPFDFTKYIELYEPKFTVNDKLERVLFEFSNQIGSFITYLLIYSLEFVNSSIMSNNNDNNKEGHDFIIKTLVEKGLSHIIPYLPIIFMNWVYPEIYKITNFSKKVKFVDTASNKNNISRTILTDRESILSLVKAFTRIYPLMSFEIEKLLPKQFRYCFGDILKEWPSIIEEHKKAM